jgi:hypothetical protein
MCSAKVMDIEVLRIGLSLTDLAVCARSEADEFGGFFGY